jgi:hypothetical protein
MIPAIVWFLFAIMVGAVTATAMLIVFIATNRSELDLYLSDYDDLDCNCYSCSRFETVDACSSECDDACAANQHCSAPDPWCGCPSCTNHRLDELPPRTTNE